MSTLLLLVDQAQYIAIAADVPAAVTAVQSGIIDRTNETAAEATTALRNIGGVAATAIALIIGWRAKGALAGMATGLVVAFIYFWGINNITNPSVSDQIDNELTGMAPLTQTYAEPHVAEPHVVEPGDLRSMTG